MGGGLGEGRGAVAYVFFLFFLLPLPLYKKIFFRRAVRLEINAEIQMKRCVRFDEN